MRLLRLSCAQSNARVTYRPFMTSELHGLVGKYAYHLVYV